jgi:ankyrin repeat protein
MMRLTKRLVAALFLLVFLFLTWVLFAYCRYLLKTSELLHAVYSGDQHLVERLLVRGWPVNGAKPDGFTPLMRASTMADREMVCLLLRHRADPNLRNHRGWTALMYAASGGEVAIVADLLAGGADARLQDKQGMTAREICLARRPTGADVLANELAPKFRAVVALLEASEREKDSSRPKMR